jgi:hypothetical protein
LPMLGFAGSVTDGSPLPHQLCLRVDNYAPFRPSEELGGGLDLLKDIDVHLFSRCRSYRLVSVLTPARAAYF